MLAGIVLLHGAMPPQLQRCWRPGQQLVLKKLSCVRLQALFMPAVRLLQFLLAAVPPAMVVADSPDMVRLLESVANLLVRRSELERSYLSRLEGELHRLR